MDIFTKYFRVCVDEQMNVCIAIDQTNGLGLIKLGIWPLSACTSKPFVLFFFSGSFTGKPLKNPIKKGFPKKDFNDLHYLLY